MWIVIDNRNRVHTFHHYADAFAENDETEEEET